MVVIRMWIRRGRRRIEPTEELPQTSLRIGYLRKDDIFVYSLFRGIIKQMELLECRYYNLSEPVLSSNRSGKY